MKKPGVRVVVASESPEARHFLKKMVEREGGVTISQAPDVPKALTLVRNIKPDAAIIDCYLPYISNSYAMQLSRVGGLDIAQRITQEAPGTEVVLLNNLDTIISDRPGPREDGMIYSLKTLEGNMLLMRNLRQTETHPDNIVFANVEAETEELSKPKAIYRLDAVIFSGACAIALGWFLIISWLSYTVGIVLAAAGLAMVFLGIAGKLIVSWWQGFLVRKAKHKYNRS